MSNWENRPRGFWHGMHVYASLVVFFVGVALIVLWVWLPGFQSRYEAEEAEKQRQDDLVAYDKALERAPQLAFEDFMAKADAQTWTDAWTAKNPLNYDDPAQIRELLDERFSDPELRCWLAQDYSAEHPRYVVRTEDEVLAYVTLSGSGLDWTVSDVDVVLESGEETSILVPEGYTVRCNGQILDSSSAEAETRLLDMEDYADLIRDPVHWETYTVTGRMSRPVLSYEEPEDRLTVTDEYGNVFYTLSEEESLEYRTRAQDFVRAVLVYYMMGNYNTRSYMYSALGYVMQNSQAYNLIRDSYDGVTWDTCYGNATFDVNAGDVYVLAGNCLMVEVAYYTEGSVGEYRNVAEGTYRVYFLDNGDGYGIYGLFYKTAPEGTNG